MKYQSNYDVRRAIRAIFEESCSLCNEDYNTLFFFNLAVSVVMFGLLFAGAPWIAKFFVG